MGSWYDILKPILIEGPKNSRAITDIIIGKPTYDDKGSISLEYQKLLTNTHSNVCQHLNTLKKQKCCEKLSDKTWRWVL